MDGKADTGHCAMPWLQNGHPLIAIDVTGRCNLRCIHCYNAEFLPKSLSRQQVSRILTQSPSDWKIYFLGGEPLVRRDILSILSESVSLGHPTSLATNATLIKRIGAEQLLDTGIGEIYVSLDGADEESNDRIRGKGSFAAIVEGLLALEDAAYGREFSLNVSVTACSPNISSIERLPAFLDDLGIHVDKLGVMPVSPTGRGADNLELLISEHQWLDLCESLCARWKHYSRLVFLCIANSELAVRYLEARHGIFLNECVADCRVARKTDACRVLADGSVVPCSGRLDLIERLEAEGIFHPLRAETFTTTNASIPFPGFIDDMSQHLKLQNPVCDQCPYHAQCQVCPLEVRYNTKPRMSRSAVCAEVWKRVEETGVTLATEDTEAEALCTGAPDYADIAIDPTVYDRELRDGRLVVICPRDQSYHVLDKIGAQFWRSLRQHQRLDKAGGNYLAAHSDKSTGVSRLSYLLTTLRDAKVISEVLPC
ncbi:hypothetical protein MNBD_GAMMA13-1327 [hydrothermal vent metagenome]|uniref:Radical SAM core domain-containing protein n=1 Tax=hydrothermal vent metagenome TaxID=652676 RepID=A0A3B0ZLR9_9ZZZZ